MILSADGLSGPYRRSIGDWGPMHPILSRSPRNDAPDRSGRSVAAAREQRGGCDSGREHPAERSLAR
eukprot:3058457-Pyramimonas_sp.AAC.1